MSNNFKVDFAVATETCVYLVGRAGFNPGILALATEFIGWDE